MRVLSVGNMYPPHHLGGYELVWRSAAEHLRGAGHDVTVLTTGFRRDDVSAPDPPHVHRDLQWWWRDHAWPRFSPRARVRVERHNARVLAHRLEQDRPDVVAWWSMGGLTLSLIERVRRGGLPAVGFVHDDWMAYGPRVDAWLRLARRAPGLAERLTGIPGRVDFSGAAEWLFVSDFTRRAAGLELARTGIAHSGIDARYVTSPGPEPPWRWRLLNVGRVDPRKGIDTAIEALAHLPGEATLTVAGEGDAATMADLRALAQRLGVDVTFAGFQDREGLERLYADADAVVFPVRWDEPWGLVPIEAMARGRPVLATGRGGSAEYLLDGENCLLFAAGDARALAGGVRRLAGDPALRARLRAGGEATAPKHTDAIFNARVEAALRAAASIRSAR
jgi:glycosyltransferase involved in cell wall biosynthesis